MKRWFNRLMALLARKRRTRSPRRVDWRGRPLAEGADGETSGIGDPDGALYATLSLPWCDAGARRPGLSGPGDPKSDMKPRSPPGR
jgi:hypothetical protein